MLTPDLSEHPNSSLRPSGENEGRLPKPRRFVRLTRWLPSARMRSIAPPRPFGVVDETTISFPSGDHDSWASFQPRSRKQRLWLPSLRMTHVCHGARPGSAEKAISRPFGDHA